MIITKLIGGLGNQLFQYAVARRLAFVRNDLFKLDISGFNDYTLRSYYLNPLNITELVAPDEEINRLKNISYIREAHFHFDPGILQLGTDLYLEGYWQSEKYFKDIEPVIRSDFTLRQPPEGENARLERSILESEAVALHIRRGDYVNNPETARFYHHCSEEYYLRAAALIANWTANPRYFIFSDDWGWAQQNIHLNYPMTFITNNANWPCEDLRLMSLCKYHIIANSTFGWWGAWLGGAPGKMVIAPQRWFTDPGMNTGDLLPEEWLKI